MNASPGHMFRHVLAYSRPLQIVGTMNAYSAIMAKKIGHRAIYLSGGACANMSYGVPDLGITGLSDVLEDARRITTAVDTPLMVDIDTGWGGALCIARTVNEMIRAGVAAVHIEDQVAQKRCGHRPRKQIVSTNEMVDRIKAATDARYDEGFFILARTDAIVLESKQAVLDRISAYVEAGADGIFAEAAQDVDMYRVIKEHVDAPLLANMTEFGMSPILSKQSLSAVGVDMVLYPFTATRAMNRAAENAYRVLLEEGDQRSLIDGMQTREELYAYLNYTAYEEKLDALFAQGE